MNHAPEEINYIKNHELTLGELINSILIKKNLIASLTGFITILGLLYALSITPNYQVNTSFISASNSSITKINNGIYVDEMKESVLSSFLIQLMSQDLQKEVFIENDFLTIFNKNNNPIDDVNSFIEGNISSITITAPTMEKGVKITKLLSEMNRYHIEDPYQVSMSGQDPEAISNYLDALVTRADAKNIIEISKLNQQKISIRLDQISIQSETLLEKAKQDRLNQIKRIKEEDGQKIRQINDQIDRARYKAKENRLNQIVVLTGYVKLAKSLGIIENNFKMINNYEAKSDLTIAIGESEKLPEWYLFGEKALIQRIALLKNRTSDDAFIPEIVTLYNQLNEIQNNNLLQTLEQRMDDIPFISELVDLNIEKNKLLSMKLDLTDSTSISIVDAIKLNNLSPSKVMIVLLTFFVGLALSILLALILSALKPDEKTLA